MPRQVLEVSLLDGNQIKDGIEPVGIDCVSGMLTLRPICPKAARKVTALALMKELGKT
jgi:hypothetical protein